MEADKISLGAPSCSGYFWERVVPQSKCSFLSIMEMEFKKVANRKEENIIIISIYRSHEESPPSHCVCTEWILVSDSLKNPVIHILFSRANKETYCGMTLWLWRPLVSWLSNGLCDKDTEDLLRIMLQTTVQWGSKRHPHSSLPVCFRCALLSPVQL